MKSVGEKVVLVGCMVLNNKLISLFTYYFFIFLFKKVHHLEYLIMIPLFGVVDPALPT
jgi:hypothetical protein